MPNPAGGRFAMVPAGLNSSDAEPDFPEAINARTLIRYCRPNVDFGTRQLRSRVGRGYRFADYSFVFTE